MERALKLYWVETPSTEENCFVAARSKRAAARYEEDGSGFDPKDCEATLVRPLDPHWIKKYCAIENSPLDDLEGLGPFYVQPEDVHELGISWTQIDGDDVFEYAGREFIKQGDLNYIASLSDGAKNVVVRSVADLLELIERDAPGQWIFRGHSSWRWKLQATVHRLTDSSDATSHELAAYERRLLNEFKRRARIYMQTPPASDWEWMVLAQHFGLPTRILDWTENPLVALYFSVRDDNEADNDGMLFAYLHGAPEIDIETGGDPFSVKQIEFIRPPHLDQRVIAQQSVFTAEPIGLKGRSGREESDLRYWHVSAPYKHDIKRELAKLGISESTLFPGLTTLAAEIRNTIFLEHFFSGKGASSLQTQTFKKPRITRGNARNGRSRRKRRTKQQT